MHPIFPGNVACVPELPILPGQQKSGGANERLDVMKVEILVVVETRPVKMLAAQVFPEGEAVNGDAGQTERFTDGRAIIAGLRDLLAR
jgi:hypothetical protein